MGLLSIVTVTIPYHVIEAAIADYIKLLQETALHEGNLKDKIKEIGDKYKSQATVSPVSDYSSDINYAPLTIILELTKHFFSGFKMLSNGEYVYDLSRKLEGDTLTYVFEVLTNDDLLDDNPLEFQ